MFCPKCGADAGNVKFCPECGAPIADKKKSAIDDVANQFSVDGDVNKPVRRKKSLLKRWWFWALIVVVVIVAIASSTGDTDSEATSTPEPITNVYANIDAIQATQANYAEVVEYVGNYLLEQGYDISESSAEWIGYSKYIDEYTVEEFQSIALGGYYSVTGVLSTGETVTGRVSMYWDEGEEPEIIDLTIEAETAETPLIAYDEAKLQQCWAVYNERAETAPETTPEPTPVSTPVPDLELLDTDSYSDGYLSYVTGHIRNNTDRAYSYVQVSINLYDDEGNQVGSTLDNINNLAPGDTWYFEALILDDSATQFSVVDITGF